MVFFSIFFVCKGTKKVYHPQNAPSTLKKDDILPHPLDALPRNDSLGFPPQKPQPLEPSGDDEGGDPSGVRVDLGVPDAAQPLAGLQVDDLLIAHIGDALAVHENPSP